MSKKQVAEVVEYRLDWFKWLVVLAILVGVAVGNSMFSEESLLYRIIAGLMLGGIACVIAAQTRSGAMFWDLAKGSRAEIRRVVWPTKSERNRATLTVVLFVLFMSVVLYVLDLFFGYLASLLLG